MFEELEKLITFIKQKYDYLLEEWKHSDLYVPINLRKKYVKDIKENDEILNTILNYRLFINTNNLDLKISFNELKLNNELNTRVKAQNSIEYKINNYIKNHEDGNIPIYKCFNDIYGLRIIFKEDINYNFSFPWELQIWDKNHEKSNIESHEKYKQEYIKWEKENKGGVLL